MHNNFYGGEVQTACKMGIEALFQPSLPSDFDEVVKKEIERFCSDILNVDIIWARMRLTKEFGLQMAKFGAEWMAGQGKTKEAVIGMATEEISINVSQQILDELDLCPGDKVVVQIRKK